MHALTLRGISDNTHDKLKAEARERGFSMNKWICSLLASRFDRKAFVPQQHKDLDHLFGSMTQEDCDAIDDTVNECRTIDKELWT